MNYRCGGEKGNPYIGTSNEGGVNRNSRSGAAIPKDLMMFIGEIMFGKIRKSWKCVICNFERGRDGRFQVFGHVASKHSYQSG